MSVPHSKGAARKKRPGIPQDSRSWDCYGKSALQALLNSNSQVNGHTDHGGVASAQEATLKRASAQVFTFKEPGSFHNLIAVEIAIPTDSLLYVDENFSFAIWFSFPFPAKESSAQSRKKGNSNGNQDNAFGHGKEIGKKGVKSLCLAVISPHIRTEADLGDEQVQCEDHSQYQNTDAKDSF